MGASCLINYLYTSEVGKCSEKMVKLSYDNLRMKNKTKLKSVDQNALLVGSKMVTRRKITKRKQDRKRMQER